MMREVIFFLGIQVKQTKQGTFVHQAKYTKDLMKQFNMDELKSVSTLMSTAASLDPDKNSEVVDQKEYRSMIGSLLYLTVTWPNIHFVVCLCGCFQASPCSSHRMVVQ
jgi:isopentenyldiphosphate isomerase